MKSWMGRMSLTTGGKTYQLVTEQARRISACRLTFFTDRENGAEARHNGAFVQDAITFASVIDDDQPTLWQDKVRLDPIFWRSLREHPVPVRQEAIRAIGTRSLAIDVYIWLASAWSARSSPPLWKPLIWPWRFTRRRTLTQTSKALSCIRHLRRFQKLRQSGSASPDMGLY
jgi:hypothetical protein